MSTSIIGLGWFDNQKKSIGQGFCLRIGSWVHATSSHWFTKNIILTFVTFSTYANELFIDFNGVCMYIHAS